MNILKLLALFFLIGCDPNPSKTGTAPPSAPTSAVEGFDKVLPEIKLQVATEVFPMTHKILVQRKILTIF